MQVTVFPLWEQFDGSAAAAPASVNAPSMPSGTTMASGPSSRPAAAPRPPAETCPGEPSRAAVTGGRSRGITNYTHHYPYHLLAGYCLTLLLPVSVGAGQPAGQAAAWDAILLPGWVPASGGTGLEGIHRAIAAFARVGLR